MKRVVQVIGGFRITIPAEFRVKMGVKEGDVAIVKLKDHTMTVIPAEVVPKPIKLRS